MIGALLGLAIGAGVLLVILGMTTSPRVQEPGPSRLQRLIDRAGLDRVGPSGVIAACIGLALVTVLLTLAISGVVMVAALAGLVAAYLPISVFKRRARGRDTGVFCARREPRHPR